MEQVQNQAVKNRRFNHDNITESLFLGLCNMYGTSYSCQKVRSKLCMEQVQNETAYNPGLNHENTTESLFVGIYDIIMYGMTHSCQNVDTNISLL